MRAGFLFLLLAYALSQFYRAFLAVLAPALEAELGATAEDLARASGLWFLAFAAMQIPVGAALDRFGPRRTAGTLLIAGGGGGAAFFALAGAPGAIVAAMTLIGVGCAPVLVSAFYILARTRPPAEFATLAGLLIGVSSFGNVASAAPTALAVEAFGWRATTLGMAAATGLVGLGLLAFLRDPAPAAPGPGGGGGLGAILRQPVFWPMIPLLLINYAPTAGVRGLWIGPYLRDVHGLDLEGIGRITLVMAAAMILGTFAYGPADRLFGTRKWVLVVGNGLAAAALIALGLAPDAGLYPAAAALAALGFFGTSYPLVMAHARSWFPPHLVGRGVTFANLLAIGGVGVLQLASGRLFEARLAAGAAPGAAYGAIFLFFGLLLAAAVAVYLFAQDRLD